MILLGGVSDDCMGLPLPTWKGLQQPSGLGRHASAPAGRRTLRSAQGTRGLASCTLRGECISAIGRVSRTLRAEPEVTQV